MRDRPLLIEVIALSETSLIHFKIKKHIVSYCYLMICLFFVLLRGSKYHFLYHCYLGKGRIIYLAKGKRFTGCEQ